MHEIETNIIESIENTICIDFEDSNQAKIIYESVLLEINTAPDYRSNMTIKLEGSKIIIDITAQDSTSFRASINSVIKWINLSKEINQLVK